MPSVHNLAKLSVSLASLTSTIPDSVTVTGPSADKHLVSYFSGWTANIDFTGKSCGKAIGGTILAPLTSFTFDDEDVTCALVKERVDEYHSDDVFDESFLQIIYLQGGSSYASGLAECLGEAYGTEAVLNDEVIPGTSSTDDSTTVPEGPYVAHIGPKEAVLGPVYRIYRDYNMAFMNGLLPNGTGNGFQYSLANTVSDSTVGIPVPSKLYSRGQSFSDDSQPLKGIRVTVKDIIDLEGVKTSNGNRAWFELYDAAAASAPAMQALIDKGAVLIGKTKTAQFANADRPTADWVDYHDAFNPRGDGYQDPGVSSAGAGAATASYDWVDVSIGTDTGGSIRIPAGKNGVFGLRPSFGALSNEGVMEEGEFFDAVGFHARSPSMLRDFGKAWLGDNANLTKSYTRFPRRLIKPANLWPVASAGAETIFDEWIADLADHLGATLEVVDMGEAWNATAHADRPGTEFWSYMQMVGFNLIWRNQLRKVIEPFRAAYAAAFGGRTPAINPFPYARYESAENITDADVDQAYDRFSYFRDWFGDNVVKADDESCSESLFLIPMATGELAYRNNVYSAPNVSSWASFTPYYFSVQSQGPEIVLPVGQVSYQSNITNVEEKLPVVVDLLAHRNCDLMLLDLAKDLADAGLLREVNTGKTMW